MIRGGFLSADDRQALTRLARAGLEEHRVARRANAIQSFGKHARRVDPLPQLGAKVTLLHMLDGSLRVRLEERDLAFTPFETLPVPPPIEDDKTLDARLDPVTARNAPGPTGSSRKGADNGSPRYRALEGALR